MKPGDLVTAATQTPMYEQPGPDYSSTVERVTDFLKHDVGLVLATSRIVSSYGKVHDEVLVLTSGGLAGWIYIEFLKEAP